MTLHPRPPASEKESSLGRLQIAGIVGLVLGSVMLAIATLELGPTEILARLETTFHLLEQSPPLIFFGVMALVCVFPIPISLFYMTAAPLFGTVPSLAWIAVAITSMRLSTPSPPTICAPRTRPSVGVNSSLIIICWAPGK